MQAEEKKKFQKNVNNIKYNTHIIEISKIEMKERENVFNEILAENFQIFMYVKIAFQSSCTDVYFNQ